VIEAALAGGCRWLSLREKDLDAAARLALLRRILPLGRAQGAVVTVHADVEAAAAAGADGVHLPAHGEVAAARARLGAAALIGISCHDAAGLAEAGRQGADYATLSPVFLTASKPGYGPALGIEGFATLTRGAALPVLALGGVGASQAASLRRAGAAGIAVMGGVMRARDPRDATARLVAALAAVAPQGGD
jgi:thiamine-phosphate pyrophosphorylase